MEVIQKVSKGCSKRNNIKDKGITMKKNIVLLGQITEKHAKVFDDLKKRDLIGEVYIVPVLNKDSLVDHFKLNDNDVNKDVMRALIKEKYIIVKGKIHTENFIRPVIELNKFLGGDRLIHCATIKNTQTSQNFILTDAACNLTLLDEANSTDIIGKAIQYATEIYIKCIKESKAVYISLLSAGGENNRNTNPAYYDWWNKNKFNYPEGQLRIEQLDVALNQKIREGKGLSGRIADIIVAKDINEGNCIWKTLTALSENWIVGGLLMGSKVPIVLNSREDTTESLQFSINQAFLL